MVDGKDNARRGQIIPGIVACFCGSFGLLLPLLALLVFSHNQLPLSQLETQLVGEWSANPTDATRTFSPDRTFSTSNGQFVGRWRVDDGRLTLTYWQPYKLPHEFNFAAVKHSIRRTRKETLWWNIEFADDRQRHSLSHPADKLQPDGKWSWTRVPGM
jgi:hypothetical protein